MRANDNKKRELRLIDGGKLDIAGEPRVRFLMDDLPDDTPEEIVNCRRRSWRVVLNETGLDHHSKNQSHQLVESVSQRAVEVVVDTMADLTRGSDDDDRDGSGDQAIFDRRRP